MNASRILEWRSTAVRNRGMLPSAPRRRPWVRALAFACVPLAFGGVALGSEHGARPAAIIGQTDVRSVLEVTNLQASDARVTATLVSRSSMRIKDIQLVVRHAFLWKDERNPGKDNPGRTEYYLVLGEVEPNGSIAFEYQPDPPLPQRTDGSFQTSIEIAGFTEFGAE